ncbi:MAG: (Fe-S)-binding protein [Deltaproteobacteria bacterium]|nr:(Fe-S)-binding protein [Deltaproteobacteria bacterium]MBP7291760.1 (Fe-S)-binding protein [Nannocystaceae bacterium]
MKQLAFVLVAIVAHAVFAYNVYRLAKVVSYGRPSNLQETWGERIASLMTFFFGQRKVMEERSSWHHLAIYWGFLVLTVASVEMLTSGLLGDWFTFGTVLGEGLYGYIRWAVDVANLIVFFALMYAFYRRLVVHPRFVPANLDAMLILGGITSLVLTHYGHHAWEMAATGVADPMQPIARTIGQMIGLFEVRGTAAVAQVDAHWAHVASQVHWWGHVLILLGFLNYLPFSKHIHVLGSGPNILLRDQGQRMVMPKLMLTDEEGNPHFENWGVGKLEDFSWKSLLDNYACTECARCTTYCPAFATDKPLSPMHLIHDLKDEMKSRGIKLVKLERLGKQLGVAVDAPAPGVMEPAEGLPGWDEFKARQDAYEAKKNDAAAKPVVDRIEALKAELAGMAPLVGGRIKDETLWACTTCGACQQVCPVFIDHPLKIVQMRTHIVLNDEGGTRVPAGLSRAFQKIEAAGNPWGLPQSQRMAWAKDLAVPTLEDNPDAEYLLFVGCAGSYSDISKKATRALVRCLQAAKVSFAVLGEQEKCNGDTLRRGGSEMQFQMLAKENVELWNSLKVRKVIASCPHCFHTIANEYPQFGGNYEVIHHSKLIAHLLDSGKLKLVKPLEQRMTYHDSCYLGRWNATYDEPRAAIAKATGQAVVELPRNREHGFCCGAGGARFWDEEPPSKRVNINRAKEIVDAGVTAVGVACPFCKTMVSDGVKHFNKDEQIEVLDIAEIVERALPPAPSPAPAAEVSP